METQSYDQYDAGNTSLGAVLRDIGLSAKDLIRSEVDLIKVELKDSAQKVGKHSAQVVMFGLLFALSIVPFMAFLIIALGEILDENYWLSSLIVALIFAALGGAMAYRAYSKIKTEDVDLHHAKDGWAREIDALKEKINELKMATQRRTV
jgi:uncharacterized membrane protein YqjE